MLSYHDENDNRKKNKFQGELEGRRRRKKVKVLTNLTRSNEPAILMAEQVREEWASPAHPSLPFYTCLGGGAEHMGNESDRVLQAELISSTRFFFNGVWVTVNVADDPFRKKKKREDRSSAGRWWSAARPAAYTTTFSFNSTQKIKERKPAHYNRHKRMCCTSQFIWEEMSMMDFDGSSLLCNRFLTSSSSYIYGHPGAISVSIFVLIKVSVCVRQVKAATGCRTVIISTAPLCTKEEDELWRWAPVLQAHRGHLLAAGGMRFTLKLFYPSDYAAKKQLKEWMKSLGGWNLIC